MANVNISGVGGSVTLLSGIKGNVIAWSGTLEVDLIEVPASFGYLMKQHDLGTAKFTGALECTASGTTAEPPFATITDSGSATWSAFVGSLVLVPATGKSITFNAVFYNIAMSRPHNGYMSVTMQFANQDGTLTMDFTNP